METGKNRRILWKEKKGSARTGTAQRILFFVQGLSAQTGQTDEAESQENHGCGLGIECFLAHEDVISHGDGESPGCCRKTGQDQHAYQYIHQGFHGFLFRWIFSSNQFPLSSALEHLRIHSSTLPLYDCIMRTKASSSKGKTIQPLEILEIIFI